MVRCSLMLRLGVVSILALIPVVLIANPPGSEDAAFKNTLALQQAMEMARHHLMEANSQKAVETLEEQLPRVNGSAPYLRLCKRPIERMSRACGSAINPSWRKNRAAVHPRTDRGQRCDAAAPDIQSSGAQDARVPVPSAPPPDFPNSRRSTRKYRGPQKNHVFADDPTRAKVEDDPFDPVHEHSAPRRKSRARRAVHCACQ